MKKVIKYFVGLMLIFMPLHVVEAMDDDHEGTLSIECANPTTMAGGEVNCTIKGTTVGGNVKNILFNLSTDNDNVSITNFQPADGLILKSEPEEGYTLEFVGESTSSFDVATFSLSVNGNFKVENDTNVKVRTLQESFFFDSTYTDFTVDEASATIVLKPIKNEIKLECERNVIAPGGKVNCVVKGSSNYSVSQIKHVLFNLTALNDNLKIKDVKASDGFELKSPSENGYSFESKASNVGDWDIATFTLEADSSMESGVDVEVSVLHGKFIFGNAVVDFSVPAAKNVVKVSLNSNSYLLGWGFVGHDIGFAKEIAEYKLTVENKFQKLAICSNYESENVLCIDADSIESDESAEPTSFTLNDKDLVSWLEKIFSDENVEEKCNEEETKCEYFIDGEKVSAFDYSQNEYVEWTTLGDLNVGLNVLNLTITGENGTEEYVFKINRLDENGKDTLNNQDEEIIENPKTGAFISITSLTGVAALSSYAIIRLKKKNKF